MQPAALALLASALLAAPDDLPSPQLVELAQATVPPDLLERMLREMARGAAAEFAREAPSASAGAVEAHVLETLRRICPADEVLPLAAGELGRRLDPDEVRALVEFRRSDLGQRQERFAASVAQERARGQLDDASLDRRRREAFSADEVRELERFESSAAARRYARAVPAVMGQVGAFLAGRVAREGSALQGDLRNRFGGRAARPPGG